MASRRCAGSSNFRAVSIAPSLFAGERDETKPLAHPPASRRRDRRRYKTYKVPKSYTPFVPTIKVGCKDKGPAC
jgi:hypothetical protein